MFVIEVEMPASDLTMPNSNNTGVFYGDWVPGGYTSGGKPEGIIPAFTLDDIPADYDVVINPGTPNEIGGDVSI